jgi:hypothetical protein
MPNYCGLRPGNPLRTVVDLFDAVWHFTRSLNGQQDNVPVIEGFEAEIEADDYLPRAEYKVHPPSPRALERYDLRPRRAVSYIA